MGRPLKHTGRRTFETFRFGRSLTVKENRDYPAAVLFDVDGTLVDSNYHHVLAWQQAFQHVGVEVESRRIHARMGKGGTLLVHELLGDVPEQIRERAKELHSKEFAKHVDRLLVVPGARRLIRGLHGAGLRVVLASSAGESEFDSLRQVLDIDDFVFASTSSGDVDQEKPDPALVDVALAKADVPAEHAVMVGDAVWDVEAARRAGVGTIGLLSGGISRFALLDAGAAAVYDNCADLLENLESSPIAELR